MMVYSGDVKVRVASHLTAHVFLDSYKASIYIGFSFPEAGLGFQGSSPEP